MESSSSKVFALIQWEDMFFDVLDTTRILQPRKGIDSYFEGEYVKAKYQGKIYSAIICELSSDRSALAPKAKDPTYCQRNKFPYVAGQTQVTLLESSDNNKGNTIIIADPGINEPVTIPTLEKKEEVTAKKVVLNRPVDARPVKRKLESTDELKQAKAADSKEKRLKTSERDAASASLVELLDGVNESKNSVDMDVLMGILKNIQRKVDNTYDIVETLLNCKYCLRRSYKRLESKESLTDVNIFSPKASSKTSSQKKLSEFNIVEHHKSCIGQGIETASVKSSNIEEHLPPVQAENVEASEVVELEIVSPSDTDLVYVGETNCGVQVTRQSLERCEKTAKSAEKLALNLLEVVLTPDDINNCTMYGNSQYKKQRLDDNKRRALRSHILGMFKDADWDKLTRIMNDKIRKMKKKMEN